MKQRVTRTTSRLAAGSIASAMLLVGCAGVHTQPADYDNLAGSGDRMAEGPGLLAPDDQGSYDDGVRVYSSDRSQPALINRGNTQTADSSATPVAAQPQPMPEPSAAQRQDFQDFQDYKRFRNMSKDSPEYQRFKDWQEWKQYQQWQQSQPDR
ncbi:hypothetical protein [Salinisphaera sp. T31B1]|uniref:hypothetical protein n=1 Tax=Salinisphaera sp. T31B1 TaxID=727963 RepID=UPI00333E2AFF